ncbi:fatty acid oxidation complex subunit alpha FadB [Marinobacterium sediminicola]|uniref:enoyl-CoA hydratase n=1 Tax=Marinobacterium sediminicola TaxID=518898 RepID=A0ABY1S2Q6_9GAMM|nr:fatty acid oxidation complex subunit alpha FadB [Marinobacterium sediminicola]ULG70676.1 fatty acid oxidation complex subunit alpha FadB [Marinobacterium sediminicola]SMR77208.1 3-hydroxyacyl-CoA dehydrogenase / enoyl-CoA hydratase / 3-hydroxybutyryl-CoA epimerase / enoyl-CoA isomerase [Marinobacterium sediminicola]
MLMEGKTIQVAAIEPGLYELIFANRDDSVNKLNQETLAELKQAISTLTAQDNLRGVLIRSDKDSFIVGADITEFIGLFSAGPDEIQQGLQQMNAIFNSVEDLPCPTVAAINGVALGGGFELCLACDYRVMTQSAKVGLPEVKLGIYPGWGGTVRLPRLIGVDNANEWICTGSEQRADKALQAGAVDAVVAPELLREAGLELLRDCIAGDFDYQARRAEKQSPIRLNQIEQMMAFESAKGMIGAKAGPHYPAPMTALKTIQAHANLTRDAAQAVEAKGFATLATNAVTPALVGLFLKDQQVKRISKHYEADAQPVRQAAVLGAGIMGGGIAYQSASRGTPILMKDINEDALQLGLTEASKLLNKQLERGKLDGTKMAASLARIRPTLSYGDFGNVDLVVEAVVENPKIKQSVLAEVEAQLPEGAILTSNTSTISITTLAKSLKKPENFCGMHFFNPVHRMPLVEVIRGEKSSEQAIARTVAFAKALGKTPIVVNDCPGFLVNRVLFPYFAGFTGLVRDGADYQQIDRVMERFGWPMGPAHLLDVVGIDTAFHAGAVLAEGFPDRMAADGETVISHLFQQQRLGQKNGKGFYRYEQDRKGKPKKLVDEELSALIQGVSAAPRDFSDEDIIARMMIPLCIEAVRCLEDGIVNTAAEVDMGLIYGIGFPMFRGGALFYIDQMGLQAFCDLADRHADLGKLYQPTDKMRAMAAAGQTYFG